MKKLLPFLFFSIFFLNSNAQTSVYHPFPDSNAVWCINWGVSCGQLPDEIFESTRITGETVISGIVYTRLATRYWYLHVNYCFTNDTTEKITYIRQDVSQKKVWIYDTFSKTESIFYDFDLQIGDTLNSTKVYWAPAVTGQFPYVISSVDSVFMNGDYRKRFNFQGGPWPGCFDSSIVEGIGSMSGLWHHPSDCFEYYSQLVVFEQDGKALIDVGGSSSIMCASFYTDVNDVPENKEWSVYPNPAFDKITISGYHSSAKDGWVEVYNMMGEKITSSFYEQTHNSELNISSLAAGVYLVQVSDGEKVYRNKFIKQ
jgi:hypothetical protein